MPWTAMTQIIDTPIIVYGNYMLNPFNSDSPGRHISSDEVCFIFENTIDCTEFEEMSSIFYKSVYCPKS